MDNKSCTKGSLDGALRLVILRLWASREVTTSDSWPHTKLPKRQGDPIRVPGDF